MGDFFRFDVRPASGRSRDAGTTRDAAKRQRRLWRTGTITDRLWDLHRDSASAAGSQSCWRCGIAIALALRDHDRVGVRCEIAIMILRAVIWDVKFN